MGKDKGSSVNIIGISEITENKLLWRMLVAEFIGTMILVVVGCLSCLVAPTLVQIALTFGLTVAAMVTVICHISGGHINPAVTVSMFVTGNISLIRGLLFIVFQCLGAICGSAILLGLLPEEIQGNLGLTSVATYLNVVQAIGIELILTFVLLFVIHAVCDTKRHDLKGSAPLAIGLTVAAVHLGGIPFTGSSVNPARSLGPALVGNNWTYHYVYWVGPMIGGILAGLVYKFILRVDKGESDSYDF